MRFAEPIARELPRGGRQEDYGQKDCGSPFAGSILLNLNTVQRRSSLASESFGGAKLGDIRKLFGKAEHPIRFPRRRGKTPKERYGG